MRWIGWLTLSVFLISGCTKNQTAEYGLKLAKTLRINISTEPPTLDWNKATDTTSAMIQDNIMEGLADYDYDDPQLGLKPALATQWESKDNAKTWIFTLREGAKWNDGMKFKVEHVVDGWERLLNPKTASEYAYFLYGIKNARAYNEGKIDDFSKVGVEVNADGQLVVHLKQPQSYFPYLLTHHSTFPIRKDVIKAHGDKWTEPENIVTLGPYDLDVWDHDKAIVLKRNETYYGKKPAVKNVLAYMIQEASTAINLYDSDKLDVQLQLPSTELAALKKRPGYKEHPVLTIYYYGFNVDKKPMDDVRVRKAIVHAIDRKEITDMLAGGQKPLSGWVPPGMFGHNSDIGLEFNPDKAKKLLNEAGYQDRSMFPKLSLAFNTNEDHQRVAENVQAQLRKNLGIKVELKNEEWKVYLSSLKTDPAPVFRLGWLADFPDPDNFLNLMTSYSDNNHTQWGSEKFDSLVDKAVSLTDQDKRKELYDQAQRLLVETEVPVAPIYSGVSKFLIKSRVKNYPLNSMGRHPFKEVSLK